MSNKIQHLKSEIEHLSREIGSASYMEVCGTHTVSIFRTGIKSLLPEAIRLISGPGCPVCVTPQGYMDAAVELALRTDTIICTFGDMVRVPGSNISLEVARSRGADVRVVISARDAVAIAAENPDKKIVWLGVGFETTAPTTAAAVATARHQGLENFLVLNGHKLALPAMHLLLEGGDVAIDGYLCPGHVSVILGSDSYQPLVDAYGIPCVIAGFEPESILKGIAGLLRQTKSGDPAVENAYTAVVTPEGNRHALEIMYSVFDVGPATWRALGELPDSGLLLNETYSEHDAAQHFDIDTDADYELGSCRCGEVIQGKVLPKECDLFGEGCTPQQPVGPCMVSSEGTCAAWYKYGRDLDISRQRVRKG